MKNLTLFLLLALISCSHSQLTKKNSSPTGGTSSAAVENTTAESTAAKNTIVKIAPRSQVEAHGKKWIISTQGKYATQIANQVMKDGGNMVDAAIAASFAISVERPQSTGLGGGGFLIYHEAKSGKNFVFDFRERAPIKATKNMYLDKKGELIPDLSLEGSLAIGTPGLVRGLAKIHHHFGKKPWASLLKPSATLARNGFEVYPYMAQALSEEKEKLAKFPSTRAIFLHADGSPKVLGEKLIQNDLALTLERLAKNPEDFYTGATGKKIVASIHAQHGLMSQLDLNQYTVKERKAVEADWNGYHVVSMPPPSSGGIHVIQILKLLEKESLTDSKHGFLSAGSLNISAQAMQIAYADRAVYLGDPDFTHVPIKGLLSSKYINKRRIEIGLNYVRHMNEVSAGDPKVLEEESNTTHFSMMDQAGNVIVSTQTINGWFGSGLVAEGTGIVLNNEMDDFSAKSGASNLFGAVGGDANAVAPKKTPLSSMSPTIVFKDGIPVLALGAPGGTRIITSVVQTILNHLVYGKDLYTSIAAARIHQQWSPDVLFVENSSNGARSDISPEAIFALETIGWTIKRAGAQSHVMAVSRESEDLVGVADPRDIGTSAGE